MKSLILVTKHSAGDSAKVPRGGIFLLPTKSACRLLWAIRRRQLNEFENSQKSVLQG
jgi:hypothetical protein